MSQQSKTTDTPKQPIEPVDAASSATTTKVADTKVVTPDPVVPSAIDEMLAQYATTMAIRFHSEQSLASGYNTLKHIVRVATGKLGAPADTVPAMRALLKWLAANADGLASETNLFRGFTAHADHHQYLLVLTYLKMASAARKAKPDNYSPKALLQVLGESDHRALTSIVTDAIKG